MSVTSGLKVLLMGLCMIGAVSACAPRPVQVSGGVATATLAPVLSQTPRLTATPAPTRTPIPTFTPVPPTPTVTFTPSNTPTATPIPPVIGVVVSSQSINVRTGPGITYGGVQALTPNTRIEVIGQSSDGRWFNVKLEDGREGWVFADLLDVLPTQTPIPTFTPTPDLTSVALGTVFPTAVLGGAPVTPTPALDLISPTPVIPVTRDPNAPTPTPRVVLNTPSPTPRLAEIDSTPVLQTFTPTPSPTATRQLRVDESVLPVIDIEALNATATALANIPLLPPTATLTLTPDSATNLIVTPDTGSIFSRGAAIAPTGSANTAAATPSTGASAPQVTGTAPSSEAAILQNGVDVLAYCDDTSFNAPAPVNLLEGSTIDIYWVWYAATEAYIQQHLDAATYEISIDGVALRNVSQYRQATQRSGSDYVVYWYAPAGPLTAGEHVIRYRVTWRERIFDGYNFYGPGTNYAVEEGSCTFTVYR